LIPTTPILISLALQGAFLEHINHLNVLRHLSTPPLQPIEVRTESDLDKCHALIIPGGESTTIALVAEREGLLDPLRQFVRSPSSAFVGVDGRNRNPTWGTCAGLILLSEKTTNPKRNGQALIGGLPIRTTRNYFGSQIASFETQLDIKPLSAPFPAIFIRAPVVEEIYPPHTRRAKGDEEINGVEEEEDEFEVFSTLEVHTETERKDLVVAVRQGPILGTAFHPELTQDNRLHEWWVKQVVIPAWKARKQIK
jgi:5'-phosphate synthase pdxT subunit